MAKIKLTKGKYAIVDDEDFDFLSQWKWKYHKDNYAVRTSTGSKQVYMHREVLKTPKGKLTDHINRNGLDNRRANLRLVSYSQNALNTGVPQNNTSGYKGVVWHKQKKLWQAQINISKRCIYLGSFKKLEDAVMARQLIEKSYAI